MYELHIYIYIVYEIIYNIEQPLVYCSCIATNESIELINLDYTEYINNIFLP